MIGKWTRITIFAALLAVIALSTLLQFDSNTVLGQDDKLYKQMLKDKGFKAFKYPRTGWGPGTIFGKVGNVEEQRFSTANDCFPDVNFEVDPIAFLDRKKDSNLSFGAGLNLLPPGDYKAVFGYSNIRKFDVTFGPTNEYGMTIDQLYERLVGKSIRKNCLLYLRRPGNKVILSVAQPESMEYKFDGKKGIDAGFSMGKLQQIMDANAKLGFNTNRIDTLTISTPMAIGYKAIKLQDLGLPIPNAAGDDVLVPLQRDKFRLKAQ